MNLYELKKDKLIETVQDFQEMFSDIEMYLNNNLEVWHKEEIRKIMYRKEFFKNPTIQINFDQFLEDSDWEIIFNDKNCEPVPPDSNVNLKSPSKNDVKTIIAIVNGEKDGDEWLGIFLLNDNRYLFASGWCDFTGWDCQSWTSLEVSKNLDDLLRFGLNKQQRTRLGV